MKVSVLSDVLQKKLPLVIKAVSPRGQLPVLMNVLLEAKAGKLQVSSTDLEIGVQIELPANVEEEGGTTVPAKTFTELFLSLPQEKVTLILKENTLEVKTSKTKSTFQTIPKEEFPTLYEEKGEEILRLNQSLWRKEFTKVIFCASPDTTRPALSGILIKQEEQQVLLVTTDGYRLSLKQLVSAKKDKSEHIDQKSYLIPARALREAIAVKETEGDVVISVSTKSNQVILEQNNTIIVSRLIDADFPSYQKIIPPNHTTQISFDREEMFNAIKICAIFARESANIVRLEIKKEKTIISANLPSVGENTTEIDTVLVGEEANIAFNARYLLDLFNTLPEKEMIFEMTGPLNPGMFRIKDDETFLHIIMPIRVQSNNEPA